jgi:riboflavin synthase
MFTGIVETVGTIVEMKSIAGGYRARIQTTLAGEVQPGESLAVNGACLTVILSDAGELHAEIGPETARVTTLSELALGQGVNLERPVRADGRFGGHLVLGHIDGVGTVDDVRREGEFLWLTVSFPATLAPFFIRKGSVAIDGVSLTVSGLGNTKFDVQLVPYTLNNTTLHTLKAGDRVNIECDMVGKYVARSTEVAGETSPRKAQ